MLDKAKQDYEQKKPNWSEHLQWLRRFIELIQDHHGLMIKVLCAIVVMECVKLIDPYLFKRIVDSVTLETPSEGVRWIVFFGINLIVFMALDSFVRDRWINRLFLNINNHFLKLADNKLVRMHLGYHQKENTGSKLWRIIAGVDKIDELTLSLGFEFVPTLIQIVVSSVLLFYFQWKLACVVLALMPLFIVNILVLNRKTMYMRKLRHDVNEEYTTELVESMKNIAVITAFGKQRHHIEKFQGHLRVHDWLFWKNMNLNIFHGFLGDMTANVGRMVVLTYCFYYAMRREITLGDFMMFMTLSEKIFFSIFRFSKLSMRVLDGVEGVKRLVDVIEAKPKIESMPDAVKLSSRVEEIRFEEVYHRYDAMENRNGYGKHSLNGVSFTIHAGESVALVGPSGGGKSTIASLFMRLDDPTSGVITVNGIDLRKVELDDFKRRIGYVSQLDQLFDETIAYNLLWAKPDASEEEMIVATTAANAFSFIAEKEKKFLREIGERGDRLSGGQQQRLSLARAIIRRPELLVLDEPTSHLDSISEEEIKKVLPRLMQGRMTLIIAHRLSTIMSVDRILVVDQGRVVEEGNHNDLLRANGFYKQLAKLQETGELVGKIC